MAETYKTSIPPSGRLSLKEIRETLYHCRDFELNLLWQRSIFLGTFLTLCFTGYGVLAVKAVDDKCLPYIYEYMCGVALVGIILSVIWIYMVKGSKAWYEVYEDAICDIEKETNPYPQYRMGVYAENKRGEYDTKFWNNKASAVSPSKVNILIGWVMFMIWSVCEVVSVYNLLWSQLFNIDWTKYVWAVLFLILAISVPIMIKNIVKSRPLLPIKEQKTETTDEKIAKSIYRYVNKFANEQLEDNISNKLTNKNTTHITGQDTEITQKYSSKINENIDELITNKTNEKTHILINQFLEKEIEKRITKKIDEVVESKIQEIEKLLTKQTTKL